MSLESDFESLGVMPQNPGATAIPTRTVTQRYPGLQLSVFPREGFCASEACMGAIPRHFVEVIEEGLSLLDPAFQSPQLYVSCTRGHDPWTAHPTCRHPRCVEAATQVASVLGEEAPTEVDAVPCLDPSTLPPTQDEEPEGLTNELLHRLLAAAQLEGLPNLVDLFQEGLKDGSIKPTTPYTNKS